MAIDHLYAPWRTYYTQKNVHKKKKMATPDECVFCMQLSAKQDDKYFIVKRFESCAIVLNIYPYNAGHLLVIPYAHVSTLDSLSFQVTAEVMHVIIQCMQVLTQEMNAQGFNIGFNIGKAGGAGIPAHVHGHVLPRWEGDTNFLPTLAHTKQISVDLHETFTKLKRCF